MDIESRIEAARGRLERHMAAAHAARAQCSNQLESLRTMEATIRSSRGECVVTATSEGAVLRIDLNPRFSAGPDLARILTETVSEAQRVAREQAADRAADLLGAASPLVQELRAASDRKLRRYDAPN